MPLTPEDVVKERKYVYCTAISFTENEDEAEDLTQRALIRAITAVGTFKEGGKLRPWLYSIVVNTMNTYVKQEGYPTIEDEPSPESRFLKQEEQEQVRLWVDKLDPKDKVIITTCDLERESYQKASELTGVPLNSIGAMRHRAKMKLRAFADAAHF